MAIYEFYREQILNAKINDVWSFISSPKNLQKITPDYLAFQITSKNLSEKIYSGMLISYKVKPLFNIKMNWLTEITQVVENNYFIDEQRVGPYKMWHHEHRLIPVNNSTMMQDLIIYQPPFSLIGSVLNKLFIERDINKIFDYRENVLNNVFHLD